MATVCYAVLQACAIRVARLASDGAPLVGANNMYVSDGLITATVGLEVSAGVDLERVTACGNICATFRDCDRLKRVTLTLELCELELELMELLTGGTLYTSAGVSTGISAPRTNAACRNGVSLEVWTKAWDSAAQAVNFPYIRWAFPKTFWTLGNVTFQNDFANIPLNGFGTENPGWADGPLNDWNGGGVANQLQSVYGVVYDTAARFPTSACGYQAVPASSAP